LPKVRSLIVSQIAGAGLLFACVVRDFAH